MDTTNHIPTADVRDLFPGRSGAPPSLVVAASPIRDFASGELPMAFAYEQMALATIICSTAPKCVIEFGTGQGTGTLLLAANAPANAQIHTVDLDPKARGDYTAKILRDDQDVGKAYKASQWATNVKQILVYPNEPIATFSHLLGKVDLAYIDGDHSYDGVRVDTLIAQQLAKPDATFVWHDFYDFPTYVADRSKRGVYPLLNEIAASGELKLYHIAGTYTVVGRRAWGRDIPSRLRQPGDRPEPFASRIVRQGEV